MTKARNIADLLDANGDVKSASLDNVPAVDLTNLSASNLTSGTIPDARIPASAVSQHATSFDDNAIVNDLSTIALRQATNENAIAYNTNSSFVDVFQDSSGIASHTTSTRNSSEYVSSVSGYGGSYSGSFTGSGGGLRFPASSLFVFTGDFTFEWLQKTSEVQASNNGIFGTTNESDWTSDAWHVGYHNSKIVFGNNTQNITNNFTFSSSGHDNNWHHYAFVRDGTTLRAYRDGVASSDTGTGFSGTFGNSGMRVIIGAHEPGGGGAFNGLLDEVRLSNNCRYPSGTTFTPPTASFTSDAYTKLLVDFENSSFNSVYGASATSYAKDSNVNNVLSQSSVTNLSASATGNFISNTITAPSSTSKMGAIITYEDTSGTNALNTDIILQLSADNGSNFTTATLTALPNYSTGIKMAKVNDLSVTAGTQLKYKISFANQSAGSKEARIRGVSLQY